MTCRSNMGFRPLETHILARYAARRPARLPCSLVRAPRLDAASASARAARGGTGRALGAADRADRRRQDARRLPAEPRRAGRRRRREGLHTLYISPLKALAVDIHRNLTEPVDEMGLPIRLETRTGDTPAAQRARQRIQPPQMLMTTPESLALLLSYPDGDKTFGQLRAVIVDEVHALAGSKRGDLLALGLARLSRLAPEARRVGLSATVAWPDELAAWLGSGGNAGASHRRRCRRRAATSRCSTPGDTLPWVGPHGALRAWARSMTRSSAHTSASSSSTRAPRPSSCSRSSGGATTRTCRSRCITAASPSSSAARSRRRWRRASCARWSRPPRSISASIGATSIWSSRSARPRACRA